MPHGGVKIGHLARETVKEGEEKNQKERKIGAHSSCRDFLLQARDKKLNCWQVVRSISFFACSFSERERGRKKKKILFPLVKQQRNTEQCSVLTLQSTPPTPSLFEKLPT